MTVDVMPYVLMSRTPNGVSSIVRAPTYARFTASQLSGSGPDVIRVQAGHISIHGANGSVSYRITDSDERGTLDAEKVYDDTF